MEHAEETDLGSQMAWIAGDLQQSCSTGVKQQVIDHPFVLQGERSDESGGEFDASRGSRSKELVAHRQSTGGIQSCGDSLGRGELSSVESLRARLFFRDSPRACRSPDPVPSRPYSCCVGRPTFIDSSNRGISAITRSLPFFRSRLLSPCSESVKTVDAF